MAPYHDHNAEQVGTADRADGERAIALVPIRTRSSPSRYKLVRDARAAGAVVPIPGPSAVIAALTLAGLPTERSPSSASCRQREAAADRQGRRLKARCLLRERPELDDALRRAEGGATEAAPSRASQQALRRPGPAPCRTSPRFMPSSAQANRHRLRPTREAAQAARRDRRGAARRHDPLSRARRGRVAERLGVPKRTVYAGRRCSMSGAGGAGRRAPKVSRLVARPTLRILARRWGARPWAKSIDRPARPGHASSRSRRAPTTKIRRARRRYAGAGWSPRPRPSRPLRARATIANRCSVHRPWRLPRQSATSRRDDKRKLKAKYRP